MKIGVYGDAHFSINSSILQGSPGTLSGRLHYLLESFKWMYDLFKKEKVDLIIDLGDLADSNILRSEEITAITEALSMNRFAEEFHILGNHERLSNNGKINSVNFISNFQKHQLITEITQLSEDIVLIPYNTNLDDIRKYENIKYAFSHLDIIHSDLGEWRLTSGFDSSEFTDRFGLLVNGHIHKNGWVIKDRVLNLGSLSGQNFSTNTNSYVGIIDSESDEVIKLYENPKSLNFRKIKINSISELSKYLDSLNPTYYYLIRVTAPYELVSQCRELLSKRENVITSRVLVSSGKVEKTSNSKLNESTSKNKPSVGLVTSTQEGVNKLREYLGDLGGLTFSSKAVSNILDELEGKESETNS